MGAFTSTVSISPSTWALIETAEFSLSCIKSHAHRAPCLLPINLLLREIWVCLTPKLLLFKVPPMAPTLPGWAGGRIQLLVIFAKPR